MINSIDALYSTYKTNAFTNNYYTRPVSEVIQKEADEATEQDTNSTLSASDQKILTNTSTLIDYLKSGLSSKFEQISKKIAAKKSGSASSGTTSGTSGTTGSSGTSGTTEDTEETQQLTEQQLKVKAQAQTLIQKLLGDTTIAKKYNNFMSKYYGVGESSSSSGGSTTTTSSSGTTTTSGVKQQVASFLSSQQTLLSTSKLSGFLNNNSQSTANSAETPTANATTAGTTNHTIVNKVKF